MTRVLGCHQIDLPENTDCPQANIFEIADRSGYDVENAWHRKNTACLMSPMAVRAISSTDFGKLTQRSSPLQFTAQPLS
jgi:hypothetical protein